jgi:hypothetical protein
LAAITPLHDDARLAVTALYNMAGLTLRGGGVGCGGRAQGVELGGGGGGAGVGTRLSGFGGVAGVPHPCPTRVAPQVGVPHPQGFLGLR